MARKLRQKATESLRIHPHPSHRRFPTLLSCDLGVQEAAPSPLVSGAWQTRASSRGRLPCPLPDQRQAHLGKGVRR